MNLLTFMLRSLKAEQCDFGGKYRSGAGTIIREVLNEKMGIDENGDIEIERAHRLGRKREDGKPIKGDGSKIP